MTTPNLITSTGAPASLATRTALVTGSTSGIGAAIARLLAARGARVVISGRDTARGIAVVTAIREAGGNAEFVAVDLADRADVVRTFAAKVTAQLGGRIDILVNNAGIYPATPTADLPDTDLDAMLAVNIRAPHVLVAEIAPAMAERGTGVIITIGSWMATVGSPFAAMYTATKAADQQMTRAWAAEFGPRGVRVNTVAPGVTRTPGNEASLEILNQMTATTPAGRPVQPDDIAYAVAFLASDEARMVHGTTFYIDGGITATRMA
jgi:NAD(P)-dependent dehydrogenase (short-subunit alcohol dehydrogenase family)